MTKTILFSVACILAVAGCTGAQVRENLGLKKEAPDEFMVLSRPSLSIPPDFNLVPPEVGLHKTPPTNAEAEARKELLGENGSSSGAPASMQSASRGENSLLNKAGANPDNRDIRTILDQETMAVVEEKQEKKEEGFFSTLINPFIPDEPDPIVDADKERERLEANKQAGKPVTEGEVPTIEQTPPSVLDQLME